MAFYKRSNRRRAAGDMLLCILFRNMVSGSVKPCNILSWRLCVTPSLDFPFLVSSLICTTFFRKKKILETVEKRVGKKE